MEKIIVAFAILILFTSTNIAHAQDIPPLPEPATGGIVWSGGGYIHTASDKTPTQLFIPVTRIDMDISSW